MLLKEISQRLTFLTPSYRLENYYYYQQIPSKLPVLVKNIQPTFLMAVNYLLCFSSVSLEWQDMYQVNLSLLAVQDLSCFFFCLFVLVVFFSLLSLTLNFRYRIETGICMEGYTVCLYTTIHTPTWVYQCSWNFT